MKKFGRLFLWDILLPHRQRLITISVVVTAIYIGIFFLLKELGNIEVLLTMLVFTDPVVTALLLAAVVMLFEKDQQTLPAIRVIPLPPAAFLLSKALSLSLLSTVCGWLMAVLSYGSGFGHGLFLAGVFFTSLPLAFAGLWLGLVSKSFNDFLAKSIGILILLGVPFVSMFGFNWGWLYVLPSMPTLVLIGGAFSGSSPAEIVYAVVYLLCCSWLCFLLALRTFKKL